MAYQFENARLLIVEDMAPMLAVTTSILNIFGFKYVDGARNVEDAYRLFRTHNHDLILTDWQMEPQDGLDLIRMVRNNEDSPNKFVPIILMTGYSDRTRVESARDCGITEFLMKPFNARDLYARIVQIIEKPRQFVDAEEFFGPDRRRRRNAAYKGGEKRGDSPTDKNQGESSAERGEFSGETEIDMILRDLANEAKKL